MLLSCTEAQFKAGTLENIRSVRAWERFHPRKSARNQSVPGEASELSVLHDGLGDPVDAGVPADDLVVGVHQNDLIVLVCGVLETNRVDMHKSPNSACK